MERLNPKPLANNTTGDDMTLITSLAPKIHRLQNQL